MKENEVADLVAKLVVILRFLADVLEFVSKRVPGMSYQSEKITRE